MSPIIHKWRAHGNKLTLQWRDKTFSKFSFAWLLDHQKPNWHPSTNQKIKPASSLGNDFLDPYNSVDSLAVIDDEKGKTLRVHWAGGLPATEISLAQLRSHSGLHSRYGLPHRKPWKQLPQLPQSSFKDDHNASLKKVLYDLAIYGVHLVTDMPQTAKETEEFIRSRLGPPRETFYGGMWDTAPRKENVNDTAYTYDALDPHTDTCYLIDSPGLQCFNCVAQDPGVGGKTRLVDSETVVNILRADHPATFKFFTDTSLVFHHTEKGLNARVCAPVITVEPDGSLKQFRYNEYDMAPLNYLSEHAIDEFYFHNEILHDTIRECENPIKLRVGDMVIVDNHRVMHGRTAFQGYRNLVGCYVGADDWIMRARAIAEHEEVAKIGQHEESTAAEWRDL